MAGWSVTADGSVLDEADSKRSVLGLPDKLRSWFDQFLEVFLREISTQGPLRPLPPVVGNGLRVDLFKVFWAVRKKGGFDCVTDCGVWDLVAGECGLGLGLGFGGALKLVYSKYLYLLERLLENKDLDWNLGSSGVDLGKQLMELQDEFSGLFPEVGERTVKDNVEMSPKSLKDSNEVAKKSCDNVGFEWDLGDVSNNEVKSEVVESGDDGDYIDVMIVNPATLEVSSCRKRKRENFCGMLHWIRTIAVDPCDPSVGSIPERSKWKSFGKEENWKRVLSAREALFTKRTVEAEQFNFQNNLRVMHPSMYDDNLGSAYNLRERQRLEKQLRTMSESGASSLSSPASDMTRSSSAVEEDHIHIEVRVGSKFQVHVPEWTSESSESDSKWLGIKDWPIENPEHRYLIERDPIGKGRQESCGCQMPGSIECVRFHIAEKRLRVKRELGSAFYNWKFNEMGEEIGLPWTAEEEEKFKAIIKANPPSLGRTFWDFIIESFPKKSWRELVTFYFNVYILHRRGYQNRFTPKNIDSDDEDLESGTALNGFVHEEPNSSKSILKSPHKPQGKYR